MGENPNSIVNLVGNAVRIEVIVGWRGQSVSISRSTEVDVFEPRLMVVVLGGGSAEWARIRVLKFFENLVDGSKRLSPGYLSGMSKVHGSE